MAAQLVVRDLSKTYTAGDKELLAVSNINLEIAPREFVSIIGSNGSGKTTLLKTVAGILTPTSGEARVEGTISYMPQDHALLPWRTVEENLSLPSDISNVPRANVKKRIVDLLTEFGLEQFAHLYPASLSGGMRQKVALLRTVLQDPALLLLDEPFASLDALTRLEAQEWLLALLQKMHASVLLITHDIREAIFLSDTIYALTSRPGTIKEKFAVPLPKPRTRDHLRTPEALELEKKLLSLLVHTP